jgi:hypothetical protein
MAPEKSPDRRNRSFVLDGIDVIENGLPSLPGVITHESTVPTPIGYWTTSRSAIVVFFHFVKIPDLDGVQPFMMEIPYYLEAGKWTVETSGRVSGSGFPFDPVIEPGRVDDLDGSHLVYGSLSRKQPEGKSPIWVATGRASREVAYVAVVQGGVEDRRKLDSRLGVWVVCTEVPKPFEVVAFDSSGQPLARLPHPSRPGTHPDFP